MLPLRHATLWRVLSSVFLVLVLVGAVAPAFSFDSKFKALSWFENVDKWIHAFTFLALTVWFAGLFAARSYWRIVVGLMLFGFAIEGCQIMISYRTADWIDIGANTAGIIVGLAVAAAGLGGWGLRIEDWYSRRTGP